MKEHVTDGDPPASPYDAGVADEDLWFLPPDPEPEEGLDWPLPAEDRRDLLDLAGWRRAEAELAPDLARTAQRFGALDERLRRAPVGLRERLAVIEASEVSWWCGDRVSTDRLSLWLSLRLTGAQEDSLALARAGWAVRRLTGGPGPEEGLALFLGRSDAADWIADWETVRMASEPLHPITRAAFGFHWWSRLAPPGRAELFEAAVAAARVAASDGQASGFLPLASGGSTALRPGGTPRERLARWYEGAGQATTAALRLLDQIEAWCLRAAEAAEALSGRTPGRLIRTFARWPLLSAPVAEAETGASRAAVQRNLDRLAALGLIREVTGQERFRLWTAVLQK